MKTKYSDILSHVPEKPEWWDETWGLSYKYLLSNGLTHRGRMKDICDLFDELEFEVVCEKG